MRRHESRGRDRAGAGARCASRRPRRAAAAGTARLPASCTCQRCPAASMNRLCCALGQKPRDASQFIAVRQRRRDGGRNPLCIRSRQRLIDGAHGTRQLGKLPLRALAHVDHQRRDTPRAQRPRHPHGIGVGAAPVGGAVQRHVGAAIRQDGEGRRQPARAGHFGDVQGRAQPGRKRRGPAAGQGRQPPLRLDQRPGRRQAAVPPPCRGTRSARHGRAGHTLPPATARTRLSPRRGARPRPSRWRRPRGSAAGRCAPRSGAPGCRRA